jgi:hypothetical protein
MSRFYAQILIIFLRGYIYIVSEIINFNFKNLKIMAKKVKNLFKIIEKAYMKGATELYGPMVRYKVSPLI